MKSLCVLFLIILTSITPFAVGLEVQFVSSDAYKVYYPNYYDTGEGTDVAFFDVRFTLTATDDDYYIDRRISANLNYPYGTYITTTAGSTQDILAFITLCAVDPIEGTLPLDTIHYFTILEGESRTFSMNSVNVPVHSLIEDPVVVGLKVAGFSYTNNPADSFPWTFHPTTPMATDNLILNQNVPEPSSAMLGMLAVGLISQRRVRK